MGICCIENYRYSESEIKNILKSIVVLIDNREQKNQHIINYFEKHNIKFLNSTLECGDYSFMVPKNTDYGINRDIYFSKAIVIERKNSLEELSGCFAQTRERFNHEWSRCYAKRKYLMIENATYKDLVDGNYNTQYNSKSFLGSLHSFNAKYGLEVVFMPEKELSPVFILATFQYYLRHLVK